MKITGDQYTIKFEVEKPEEIPTLQRFGTVIGPYCSSWIDTPINEGILDIPIEDLIGKRRFGIEIPTQKLFEIVSQAEPLKLS